jgi:hypothetical protein
LTSLDQRQLVVGSSQLRNPQGLPTEHEPAQCGEHLAAKRVAGVLSGGTISAAPEEELWNLLSL